MIRRSAAILKRLALLAAVPWAAQAALAQDLPAFGELRPDAGGDDVFPPEVPAAEEAPPVDPTLPGAPPAAVSVPTGLPAEPSSFAAPSRFWERDPYRPIYPAYDPFAWHGASCGVPPLGTSVNAAFAAQIQNGLAARMALYDFDFCRDDSQLTSRGKRQLAKIARRLPATATPVLIEASGDVSLDRERRQQVLEELAAFPFPVPAERVVTAYPSIRPLDGVDAVLIERKLQRIRPRAQPVDGIGGGSFPPTAAPNP